MPATSSAAGRPAAVDGRLEWREWQDRDGNRRQSVEIVADSVQFLGTRGDRDATAEPSRPASEMPADSAGFEPAPSAGADGYDDLPF